MIRVQGLAKTYRDRKGGVAAVNGLDFEVEDGTFYTLLGPSGCGKTTTLRCIAGLETPESGEIALGGTVVYSRDRRMNVAAHKRPAGMVFQSYAIWPHMTVFDNVAFPLRNQSPSPSSREVKDRVEEALTIVRLSGFESRMATQLSGGQQQRLALARALIRRPKVLLLDEPLSNLDATLRDQMREEIRDMQRKLKITTLYVTHDQIEALSMSNRIAVMDGGVIVQDGKPRHVYNNPANGFVARFLGAINVIPGLVSAVVDDHQVLVETPLGELLSRCSVPIEKGNAVEVAIRPENIAIHVDDRSRQDVFGASVAKVMFLGEYLDTVLEAEGIELSVRAHPSLRLRSGMKVQFELPPHYCSVIPDSVEASGGRLSPPFETMAASK